MIRHEKIAARVITSYFVCGSKYRLSHELTYGPGIERTWFVSIGKDPFIRDGEVALYVYGKSGRYEVIRDFPFGTTHAEALDALGYELIEEET